MVTLLVSQTNPVGVRILNKKLNSSLPLGPGLVQVLENLEVLDKCHWSWRVLEIY